MKKNKIGKRIFFGLLLLLLFGASAGCGKKDSISLEEVSEGTKTEQKEAGERERNDEADRAEETDKKNGREAQDEKESESDSDLGMLSVYVCGAVHAPGVYELPAGSRLYQAVDAAGGMREDADQNYLNLAMELSDGMKLQVPTKEEVETGAVSAERTETAEGVFGGTTVKETASGTSGLVNINTADEALLMTLPGIGEAKAKSIIAYREEKGSFKSKEDIMNITGIKQAVYEKIKDAICVN